MKSRVRTAISTSAFCWALTASPPPRSASSSWRQSRRPRAATVRVSIAADVHHQGQGESIIVELGSRLPTDPSRRVEEAFEEAYVRLYGRRPPGVEAEVMTWRVRVLGPDPRVEVTAQGPRVASRKGWRRAWFPEAGMVPPESATLAPPFAAVTAPPHDVAPEADAVFTRFAG